VAAAKRHIVLLRGINVGGHQRIAMADLRKLLTRLGYDDARTHLQSGNVVLTSDASAAEVRRTIERGLASDLNVDVEVFIRSRKQIADVVASNPLADVADNPSRHHVLFLSGTPSAGALREAAKADIGGERFAVIGREIYAWYPDGLQNAKLVKLLSEKRLGVSATARNWNTVLKLLELADDA
jgi:uncharacterized protein (DUF1697 family)